MSISAISKTIGFDGVSIPTVIKYLGRELIGLFNRIIAKSNQIYKELTTKKVEVLILDNNEEPDLVVDTEEDEFFEVLEKDDYKRPAYAIDINDILDR